VLTEFFEYGATNHRHPARVPPSSIASKRLLGRSKDTRSVQTATRSRSSSQSSRTCSPTERSRHHVEDDRAIGSTQKSP